MSWGEILGLYMDVIREKTSVSPKVFQCGTLLKVDELYEGGYNTIYDREWDRCFNSALVNEIIGEKIQYVDIRKGLKLCLEDFLDGKRKFRTIDWDFEAYQDLLTGVVTPDRVFPCEDAKKLYSTIRSKTIEDVIGKKGCIEQFL